MAKEKTISSNSIRDLILDNLKENPEVSASELAKSLHNSLLKKGITRVANNGNEIELSLIYCKNRVKQVKQILKKTGYSGRKYKSSPAKIENIKINTQDQTFEKDYEIKQERSAQEILKHKYDDLMSEYDRLKKLLGVQGELTRPMQQFKIQIKGKQKDRSVAVVLASDWHYEEEIKAEAVNHLNQYTLAIADKRIENFFSNVVKILKKEQNDTTINTLVLALLGDFITGNIHEDNVESAQLGVGQALWRVKSRIHAGIEFILENTDVNLIIPCHSGNHARHTKKQRVSNENDNSLEWIMYRHLAEIFALNPRVDFMVGESYHSYIEIFPGYTIRFHHGHNVKYGGGVGGITIPINKAIGQWNRNRHVQLDCMGHFHQYFDGGNFVVNGSVIGYGPYSLAIKGGFEKPSQSFFLINGKYLEKTMTTKIFME